MRFAGSSRSLSRSDLDAPSLAVRLRWRVHVDDRESVMNKLIWPVALVCVMAQPSLAGDREDVLGIWKLVAYQIEVQATGEKQPVMGENPTGYVTFLPEGRVFFVLTGEGRKPAKTAEERAQLLNTLVAYTGRYRIESGKWITK